MPNPSETLFALACLLAPAWGQSTGGSDSDPARKGLLPLPDYTSPASPYLSGDWGGSRTRLAGDGLRVDAVFTQVAQSVVDGGKKTGSEYGGKLETFWDLDLDKMGVLPGALVTMHTESRYGNSVNGIAGTLLPVNDVLYFPLTDPADEDLLIAITELRYTQFFSKKFGVFAGKFIPLGGDVNEFAGGRGTTQFMSHPFLSASVTALINPYSTLGGGVFAMPTERTVISSSLYSSNDSSTTSGFDELGDGWTWNTSARTQYEIGSLPGGMMLSGQYGFDNDFVAWTGQFVDDDGLTIPVQDDTWNVFWNGWQYLHVEDESKKLIDVTDGRTDRRGYGLFARAGTADRDTNPLHWIVSLGIGGRGVGSRDHDSYGIGYAYSQAGDKALVTGTVVDDDSHRGEAYYTVAFLPGVELTFNFQYADSILAEFDPATILGLRLRLQF